MTTGNGYDALVAELTRRRAAASEELEQHGLSCSAMYPSQAHEGCSCGADWRNQRLLSSKHALAVPAHEMAACCEALVARLWHPREAGERCPGCRCEASRGKRDDLMWTHTSECRTKARAALDALAKAMGVEVPA